MKTFNVYRHPERGVATRKAGFCWPALFFNFMWMGLSGLWWQATVWFLALASMPPLERLIVPTWDGPAAAVVGNLFSATYIALLLVPGLLGNRWIARKLIKAGYQKTGSFEASIPVITREAINA